MKKLVFALLACATLFVSCNKEISKIEGGAQLKEMSFLAATDNQIQSKTSLDGVAVNWAANETIYVFDGYTPRVFKNDEAGSVVSFTGMIENTAADKYYAVYPSGTIKTNAGNNVISTMIPYSQQATANSFANGANAAVAVSSDKSASGNSSLQFKNVGAIVKFVLTDSEVRKIKIESLADVKVSGHVDVTFAGDDSFTSSVTSGINYVILDGGSSDLSAGTPYYVAIASGNYTGGFRITLVKDNGSYASFSKKEGIEIARNELVDFGTLPAVNNWKAASATTKITNITQVVDGEYAIISFDEEYYLPNEQATNNAPKAVAVTKTNDVINIEDAMKWNVSKSTNTLTITSAANPSWKLFGANTNEGIRINNTSSKSGAFSGWTLVSDVTYGLILKDAGTTGRYLSTYGTADWRNYGSGTLSSANRAASLYTIGSGPNVKVPNDDDEFAVSELSPADDEKVARAGGQASFKVTSTIPWSISVDSGSSFTSFTTTKESATETTVSITFEANSDEDAKERAVVYTITPEQGHGFSATTARFSQLGKGKEYTKVTNVSSLNENDVIILVYENSTANKYAGAMGSYAYFTSVGSIKDAIEITLGKSGSNWTMTTSEGLVGATAVKSLSVSANNRVTTWTISISNGNASISSTTNSYGTIKYNTSSPRFLNYASGQGAIQIYKVTE